MVMFREDEARLKAAERAAEPRWKKRLRRLFKALMILSVIFAVGLFALSRIGGDSDALKAGIEDYLQNATGFAVEIETLNRLAFFPQIHLDFSDAAFYQPSMDAPGSYGARVMSVDRVDVMFGFWDVFLGRGHLRFFEIEGLTIEAGLIDHDPVHINGIRIIEADTPTAGLLVVDGTYRGQPLYLSLEVDRHGEGRATSFHLPEAGAFSLIVADAVIDGILRHRRGRGLRFEIAGAGFPDPVASGQVHVIEDMSGLSISGEMEAFNTKLKARILRRSHGEAEGTIDIPVFDPGENGLLADFIYRLVQLLPDRLMVTPDANDAQPLILMTNIHDIRLYGQHAGMLSAAVNAGPGLLRADPLAGRIFGGVVDGAAVLQDRDGLLHLSLDASIEGLNYGEWQNSLTERQDLQGRAEMRLDLAADFEQFAALPSRLEGRMTFEAAEGTLAPALLTRWDATVADALPAGDRFALQCALLQLDIAGGQGRSRALAILLEQALVHGDAMVNIMDGHITADLAVADPGGRTCPVMTEGAP